MLRNHRIVILLCLACLVVAAPAASHADPPLGDYTKKLRLAPGLVIVGSIYGWRHITGELVDYDVITTVNSVTDGLDIGWSMSYPLNIKGQRLCLAEDLRNSHKVSAYSVNGESGARAGYACFSRISDVVYKDLKAGKKTAFELDGPSNPLTIQKVGEEDLVALVNERRVRLHTLKSQMGNGWTAWVLDNPAFPTLVKLEGTLFRWVSTSYTYPAENGKALLADLKSKGAATTHAVHFAFNSADLTAESKPILDVLATYLKGNPATAVRIEGHTDNIGGPQANLDLSRRRAESVKKYLAELGGVDAARLEPVGMGLAVPVADNATPEGRAMNRRVVFRETKAGPGR